MAEQEQEKKDRELEDLEAIEMEDEDLEDVSGGFPDLNCGCSVKPSLSSTGGS